MIKKLLFLTTLLIVAIVGLEAQTAGTLNGIVKDDAGLEIIGAAVTVKQKGSIINGATTGLDGDFSIKQIPAGYYDVEVTYVGYNPILMQNVHIPGGKITVQNFEMTTSATLLGEVVKVEYKEALISADQTQSGGTIGSKDIAKMSGRSAAAVATTVAGVYSDDGGIGGIRGARSSGNVYYVDGVKVSGSIPKAAVEQVSVITGGIPAEYGDVTGGIISQTTKGPSSQFWGSVELETSQYLDPYGFNLAGLTLSGPILKVKNKTDEGQRTVIGFLLSAQGYLSADNQHNPIGIWRANDDVIQSLKDNPTRMENGLIYNNMEFLHSDSFTNYKNTKNTKTKYLNAVAKIDISPIRDLNFTIGSNVEFSNYTGAFSQMFNYDQNAVSKSNAWTVYARLTQRFRSSEDDNAKIKNPYYQIQVDYNQSNSREFNPDFTDHFFRYGHLGYYNISDDFGYEYTYDDNTGLTGWVTSTPISYIDAESWKPSEYNPLLSRYVEQYYEFFPGRTVILNDEPYGYYRNGDGINMAYGSTVPGTPYTGYSYSTGSQLRAVAKVSADIGKHELTLGFEYEQRSASYYSLSPYNLWFLARQLTNFHISQLDSVPHAIFDSYGNFADTIKYDRLYNASAQSLFDKNIRQFLGLPIDGTEWVNIDNLNPDDLQLSWFSADELLNNGNSYVSYYGYDYLGKKLNSQPTLNDFLTKTDPVTGKKTRPIGAFTPNYIAGYIQDKFAFKDLIFNIGVRVDRYDANQMGLVDNYSIYETVKYKDVASNANGSNIEKWKYQYQNVPDDAVLYVDNIESNNPSITGYRVGDVWYNASGAYEENPRAIAGANGVTPLTVNKNLTEPEEKAFEDYKPQTNILPRIAFSFPISEDALFFAHYDILTTRPSGNQFNPVYYLYLQQYNQSIIPNPNLLPEKTVDYSLGFQQKLTNSSSLKLEAFYREMRDMVQTIAVKGGYPTDYYTYGNIDFGTVKGVTATFDLRRTGNVTMRASYTLQFAKATGSDPTSQSGIVSSDKPNLKNVIATNQDQRHAIQLVFDYRFGGKATGEAYHGPKIKGKNILANTGLNLTVNAGSGSPYTVYSKPSTGRVIIGTMNGARKPWRATVNLRLDRDIRIKLAKEQRDANNKVIKNENYGMLNVYLDITNLLNTKNVLSVYSYTGNAKDDGYLSFDEYQSLIAVQTDEESYRNYYIMSLGSGMYSSPRTIRLGVSFSF